jgi:predicted Rdx family selenoprotein
VAARLAADLRAETDIVVGRRGEFTILVDGRAVAEKDRHGFPTDDAIVAAVRQALAR